MKNIKFKYLVIFLILLLSCGKEEIPTSDNTPVFSDFSFFRQHNPGLTQNVYLDLENNNFTGILPPDARVTALVASFKVKEDYIVRIGGILQESGVTVNDFSHAKIYTVEKPGSLQEEYTIEVSYTKEFPHLYISTEGLAPVVSKDDYINAHVTVDGGDSFENIEDVIKIRGRGNSTWGIHPKKPYQIKFEEKTPILGMPEDKRWLLLAEYSDKTFMRNRLAFEMGHLSKLEWTPLAEYAYVTLNDEFQGLYLISQKVEECTNRVNITNDGFLLEIDQESRLDPDDIYFYTNHFLLNIKEPDLEEKGEEYEYIKEYMQEFEDVLFRSYFKDPIEGYRKYVDVESVVDWYLINEITKNVDAKWFASIFMYLAPGEKLKMGPIWDFDLAFGNVNYADSEFPDGWWVKENPWISRMFEDPYFVSLVKDRYSYFRSEEVYYYDKMDEWVDYIELAQKDNDAIWHTIGMWVWPNSIVYEEYGQEVSYVKTWLGQRLSWLDYAFANL